MAKNIKAIKCPSCGSTQKTEIKPEQFRCLNCDTEYYLDNDDINININHVPNPNVGIDHKSNKKTVLIVAVVAMVLFIIFTNIILQNNKSGTSIPEYKTERKYDFVGPGEIVYQNTITGKAVFMRIGREDIEGKNNSVDYVNTHAVFIDPVTKKQFKDQVIVEHTRRLDEYSTTFNVFGDGTIYMKYPGPKLFKLDRAKDKLIEITNVLIKNHPELGAGLATIDMNDYYINILTNEGNKYYYVPAKDLLTNDLEKTEEIVAEQNNLIFRFDNSDQLMKYNGEATNLTPARKYFEPEIIYQDETSLIIATGATAKPDGPVMLQSIDTNTGKIIWSLPAKTFYYRSAAKCTEGFAIEYSSGEDHDYISGVLVITPKGEIVSDYLIKRAE